MNRMIRQFPTGSSWYAPQQQPTTRRHSLLTHWHCLFRYICRRQCCTKPTFGSRIESAIQETIVRTKGPVNAAQKQTGKEEKPANPGPVFSGSAVSAHRYPVLTSAHVDGNMRIHFHTGSPQKFFPKTGYSFSPHFVFWPVFHRDNILLFILYRKISITDDCCILLYVNPFSTILKQYYLRFS